MKTLLPRVVTFLALFSLASPAWAAKPDMCGNGRVQQGEWCDTGGDSATCDADCSPVDCGDGHVNAEAGEQCDDAGESAACDADCTLPTCGDGVVNRSAGEDCDDATDTTRCDADCTPARCGDGYVNAAAGEQCDTEGESATCDADCTLPTCGDSHVNTAAGEDCDGNTPAAGTCVSCALVCAAPTPSCTDETRNGDETDVDCGGSCAPCAEGKQCLADADCLSASCVGGICGEVQGAPSIVVSPTALNFGNVLVGTSASLFVTVLDAGPASLVVSAAVVAGAAAAEFSVEPSGSFTVLPGDTRSVLVTFTPATVGVKTASLVFSSNDPASPTTVISVFGAGI